MVIESVKKSLEKSKNVLEEKRKNVKQKICIKKHVYNNCYELRSRSIYHTRFNDDVTTTAATFQDFLAQSNGEKV